MGIRKITTIKTAEDFGAYLKSLGVSIPFDAKLETGPTSPLAKPVVVGSKTIGNRFASLPMEGWDSTVDGAPTEITERRWQRLGLSGAKLIWGEAIAVRRDGRDSASQLMWSDETVAGIARLRETLVKTHKEHFGKTDDLMVGAQLTHSGRVARKDWDTAAPMISYHHPVLDKEYSLNANSPVLTDSEISHLIEDVIKAAKLAKKAGFDFVDVKHCHGYFGHELLSAVDRPGIYGGSFENRTRFLREVVNGIRSEAPGLTIGVRLSAFDFIPFRIGKDGVGEPFPFSGKYRYAFGGDGTGVGVDLTEPIAFLKLLDKLNIKLVSISAGAAYDDHILHPAASLYSNGYSAPEDPLVGVNRLISATAELKRNCPNLLLVSAGYSYLHQWLPNVGQPAVRSGMVDFIGLGRMALAYPDLPADVLAGKPVQINKLCVTCGLCAIAPNNCVISGCYTRDDFYKKRPEFQQLKQAQKDQTKHGADSKGVLRRL
jgi:NADPH2 dehydrogenase